MTITIEDIEAKQNEVSAMISKFKQQAKQQDAILIPEQLVELAHGEHYSGIILGKDGESSYHLIRINGEAESVTWDEANTWAKAQGGDLPTRREQALLFANLKDQFKDEWYWSSQQHEKESGWAWYQGFSSGLQLSHPKNGQLRAVAVRRLPI